jgi:hypothetical protein
VCRVAMFAYLSLTRPRTSASRVPPRATVQSAATISSLRLLLSCQCLAATIFTKGATTSTCRLRTNAQFAKRVLCVWICSGRS